MSRPGEDKLDPGAQIAIFTICLVILVIVLFMPVSSCMKKQDAMTAKYQAIADKWERDCKTGGGRIVTNYKGSPTYLCFNADGRLVGTR